jgi:hypothetical protein
MLLKNNIKPNSEVRFWQTVQGKRILRLGVFKGFSFSRLAVVVTGYGTESYTHYIKPEKLIVVKEKEDGNNSTTED